MSEAGLAGAIADAAARLEAAGVESARLDAELLAAHRLGLGLGELRALAWRGAPAPDGLAELVQARAERIPLQHLTGRAPFRRLSLAVGPGVFIPRPETEQVAQVAIDYLAGGGVGLDSPPTGLAGAAATVPAATNLTRPGPTVVDLCTGTGAIAAAIADEVPSAQVWAVEVDRQAHAWAERNLAGTGVRLILADAATALADLDGQCDLVVANPPYIPPGAVPRDPEVRDWDPPIALYGGGADGLAVPRVIVGAAARLLKPGGMFVMEHGDTQAEAVRTLVATSGAFDRIETRPDLTGRDRMVRALRRQTGSG